jgi:putative NADH-flavin reductase
MDIAIYGATGAIGSKIVEEAVSRGHDVTAITRRGGAIANAAVISADLTDTAEFIRVAAENDVVVIAAGPSRTGESHEPTIEAHRAIIAAKPDARIFVVGGAGSLFAGDLLLKDTPEFPEMYKPEAATMTAVLNEYKGSTGLDWTVLSPAPEIAPGERTGTYNTGLENPVGASISTEDFAVAVLDELEKPTHRHERFTVAN